MTETLEPEPKCQLCREDMEAADRLICRICTWSIHPRCVKGPRLCPKCAKPLVTAAASAEFDSRRDAARRAAERTVAAFLVIGGLWIAGCAAALDKSPPMPARWLGITIGTWALVPAGLAATALGIRFYLSRVTVWGQTGLLLYSAAAVFFLIWAYAGLHDLAKRTMPELAPFVNYIAAGPLYSAPGAWFFMRKRNQIPKPGSRGGPSP